MSATNETSHNRHIVPGYVADDPHAHAARFAVDLEMAKVHRECIADASTLTTTEAAHGIGLTVPQFQKIARDLSIKPAEGQVSKRQGGGYRWTEEQVRAIRNYNVYARRFAKREDAEARLSKETPCSDVLMRRLSDALPKHGATLAGGTTTLVVPNSWVEDAIGWIAADARRRNDAGISLGEEGDNAD